MQADRHTQTRNHTSTTLDAHEVEGRLPSAPAEEFKPRLFVAVELAVDCGSKREVGTHTARAVHAATLVGRERSAAI
jgi:hypothetical protein